jgi:hypothetical protein
MGIVNQFFPDMELGNALIRGFNLNLSADRQARSAQTQINSYPSTPQKPKIAEWVKRKGTGTVPLHLSPFDCFRDGSGLNAPVPNLFGIKN